VRDRLDRRPPPPIGVGRLNVRDRLRQMLAEDHLPKIRNDRTATAENIRRISRERVNPFDKLMRMMPPVLSYGCYADLQNTGRDLPPL
jgi:hypothetical protein